MEITIEKAATYTHVKMAGELRADDGLKITEEIHPILGQRGSTVVVDLSSLNWLDSGGLGLLVSLNSHARLSQSRVILVKSTKFVAGVLEVTQLDKWFDIAEDLPAAEKMLA